MKKAVRILFLTFMICLVTGLRQNTAAKADGYCPSNMRKLYISGPVEIHILDTDGWLGAEYIEDAPDSRYSGYLPGGMGETGEWSVYLPQDSGYNVEITATSDGTIDIIFARLDDSYNIYYQSNYLDIAVKKGDVLTMEYVQEFFSRDYSEKIEKPVAPVLKKGKKTISPSAEYKNDVPECTVRHTKRTKRKLSGVNTAMSWR